MHLKNISAKQLLEKKWGPEKAAAFVIALKDIYRNGKYYGEYYKQAAVKVYLNPVTVKGEKSYV
ncbi:MAG: hypothetical protein GY950_22175 [bacterium]|nr:hypothetical protein [bacterium]